MLDASILAAAVARKAKGITLHQISALTRISVRWLQAIEEGEFKKLPGGVYDISYIRQYAGAIDQDAADLLAAYHHQTCPPPEPGAKKMSFSLKIFRPGMA